MNPTNQPFESLTDSAKQPYLDKAAELLDGLLWCDRDWSAWGWGTMGSNDFHDAASDDDIVYKVAAELYNFRLGLETRTQEQLRFEPRPEHQNLTVPLGSNYRFGTCEGCQAKEMYLQVYGHQRDGLLYICPGCFVNFELDHGRIPEPKDIEAWAVDIPKHPDKPNHSHYVRSVRIWNPGLFKKGDVDG